MARESFSKFLFGIRFINFMVTPVLAILVTFTSTLRRSDLDVIEAGQQSLVCLFRMHTVPVNWRLVILVLIQCDIEFTP